MTTFNSIIRLRRDTEENFDRIKDVFIPANGEVCLVDTQKRGLRAKVGNGIFVYSKLEFTDEDAAKNIFIQGYLYENQFYYESFHRTAIESSVNKIYADIKTGGIYRYDGTDFISLSKPIPLASAEDPGIMKLFTSTGNSEEGTMTQKAITDALKKKVEAETDDVNELLILKTN